jgi:sugar fermentation stimulation protein A
MKFDDPLIKGKLRQRYKRFLADVELEDGCIVTAHCANSGSMKGLKEPGSTVYLSPNKNPKAKLDWRWELIDVGTSLVGINTSRPNHIVEAAIRAEHVPELTGYENIRREVKYGKNSRIDILLEGPGLCYVEVKSVTLKEGELAIFPDSVTARGTKHLNELMDMVAEGHRAVMFYLAQRSDCSGFAPADEIDPTYASALRQAHKAGVEIFCYQCELSPQGIKITGTLPVSL